VTAPKQRRESRESRERRERLDRIRAEVADGRLVIRKASQAEREPADEIEDV
jgi:hypothetical protein